MQVKHKIIKMNDDGDEKMGKKIEITYDIDYGIFALKTEGLFTSKTKCDKFERKLKKQIDDLLKEL